MLHGLLYMMFKIRLNDTQTLVDQLTCLKSRALVASCYIRLKKEILETRGYSRTIEMNFLPLGIQRNEVNVVSGHDSALY